jgi:hypothetical protein
MAKNADHFTVQMANKGSESKNPIPLPIHLMANTEGLKANEGKT